MGISFKMTQYCFFGVLIIALNVTTGQGHYGAEQNRVRCCWGGLELIKLITTTLLPV